MKKRLKNLLVLFLSVMLTVSHLNVNYVRAEETGEGFGGEPITEVEKNGLFSSPLLGEFEEEQEQEDTSELYDAIYEDTDVVRVSIVLRGDSAIDAGYSIEGIGTNYWANSYRDSLKRQQDSVAKRIANRVLDGEELEVVWNHTLAANIMSAYVPYGKIEEIKKISGVKDVFIENKYEAATTSGGSVNDPNMITSRDMTQTTGENASEYTGQGSKVAIIDTGLDIEHISFDADAFMHAAEEDGFADQLMTEADVKAVEGSLNVPGQYLNEKIPYYYNYVDGNLDVSHVNDTESGHGSHVAGIAAANKYIEEEDGSFVNAVEKYYAVGQAPDAQVFVMKVFGAGGGAYDSDYFAAIEDAIVLGADSVNLSLGSSVPGFVYANNEYQDILNNLVDKGTVIVFSAGNNSSWDQVSQLYADDINYSAGGTPGTYLNTFSVASVDNDGYTGEMLDISGELIPFGESASYGNLPIATLAGDHEYIYVDAIGYIYDQDYDYGVNLFEFIPELVEGRIAACNRGSSSFYMKANGAVEAGAIATIIVNNQPGAMGGMNLKGYEHTEPVVSILQTDGELLKDKATEKGTFTGIELVYDEEGNLTGYQEKDYDYYIGKITVSGDISNIKYNSETYMVSDFSSWGVPGSLILKPEIAAPGGNIYSLKALQLAEDDKGNVYSTGGHDEYELESGTSMAAPQIAGIIAVIAQYYRENDIEAKTGLTLRQFAQSLLMSTATPLIDDYDCYFPVLQQGAGLANVEGVVSAKSFIHMSEDDETLTAKTGVAADYKIKAEMGDDASRAGQYEYTFDITNFGDETIKYNLNTDLFTQDIEEWEDTEYLAHYTTDITGNVTYNIVVDAEGHDVDKDGDTDQDDAQAILDYLTGNRDGAELDLEAGKLDEDDEVTSRDAYLLLMFLENEYGIGEDWFYLQAGKQATVTVSIDVSSSALKGRENGGYVEGFTYVKGDKDVEHSIPLLAYYGSWTDPSMYDAVSYLEQAMGSSEKYSYFDAENTNGYQLKYKDNRTAWFTGNPYVAEPDIDEERFAMNSATTIRNARYTLIRNGIAREVLIKDAEGNIVKKTGFANGATYGAFYNSQTTNPGWEQTGAQRVTISTKPADLGFAEGDQFSVELYNVPEYYGLLASEVSGNSITEDQLLGYIEDGEVGDGAVLGYSFTVDDTAPVISKYEMSEDKSTITVTAKDNYYIAFIGLMDVTGNEVILAEVPEQSAPGEEVTVTLDVTSVENLPNAAALVVGDYAHNEEIRLARFREGTVEYKYYVYQLTDEIVDGGEYIIANSNVAGKAYALYTNDPGFYTSSARTVIHDDAEIPYIKVEDAEDKILWESTAFVAGGQLYGYFITSVADGGYLRDLDPDTPFANLPGMNYGGLFMYDENLMYAYPYESGMYYDSGYFMFGEPAPVYLYVKTEIVEEIDPEEVSSITINPSSVTLIMGVDESRQLTTTISPVTVEDKSVTWTSGDPEIATVDENGLVKAVSVGEVTVTATSNKTPDMSATVNVNVVEAEPMNAYIYGLVSNADGVGIAMIDMNDMATYPAMSEVDEILNGGRSGNYFYGVNSLSELRRFSLEDFSEDGKFRQSLDSQYLMIDGADVYSWTAGNLSYPFVAAGVTENNRLVFYTEGTNLWYLDVTDLEPIVAMALISYNDTDPEDPAFYYALLSDQGTLYLYEVYGIVLEDGGVDIDGSAMELGKVEAISFTDDLSAYSMTCSFGHVLDEEDNPNYDDFGLFIADNNSKGIYYVDMNGFLSGEDTTKARFVGVVEGAKNLSALFNDYYDSLTTEESEDTGSALIREFAANAEIISTARGQKVELAEATEETAEQPVTEEAPVAEETVTEEPVAEEATVETPAEEPAEQPVEEPVVEEAVTEEPVAEEPADQSNEATGTLNAVRGYQSSTSRVRREGETTTATEEADSDKADDDTVTITVTEEDLSNNGLYIVNYDAEVLEYVSTEYDRDYYSVNDSEEGTIKVSFADIDGFEAGEAIVTITFKKGCEDTVITTTTVENNEELGLSEESEIEVEGKGHFWGEPEWTWSADHTSATAKFTCENNEEHVVELTEKAIIEETKATTEKEGKRVYTVTVTGPDGKEYTIQYSEVIPKTVDTGDHSNIQLWTTMLTISIIAMAGIFLTMKRKNAILK